MARRELLLATLSPLLAVGLAACQSEPGEAIAARIRQADPPFVRDVIYRPSNLLDPAEVVVHLRPGVTEAQAEALWCQVVVPAGGSSESGPSAVTIWDDPGTTMMGLAVACP